MKNLKNYIGVWLILTVALIAIVTLAFVDEIKVGDLSLKQAPIKETLLAAADTAKNEKKDSVKSESGKDDVVSAQTDTVPKSILIFGDSMTWNLALRLAEYAHANGHTVHTINWDSSNTKIWAESDTLSYFLKKHNVSYVFVSLGSNELYLSKPDRHKPYVETILNQIGDIPYIWIGPPNWTKDSGLNDMLESTCAPKSFFRSAGMTFQRKKDGRHPTKESSADWMDSVVRWMPKSAHPIVMNLPPDSLKINSTKMANITPLKPKR